MHNILNQPMNSISHNSVIHSGQEVVKYLHEYHEFSYSESLIISSTSIMNT